MDKELKELVKKLNAEIRENKHYLQVRELKKECSDLQATTQEGVIDEIMDWDVSTIDNAIFTVGLIIAYRNVLRMIEEKG